MVPTCAYLPPRPQHPLHPTRRKEAHCRRLFGEVMQCGNPHDSCADVSCKFKTYGISIARLVRLTSHGRGKINLNTQLSWPSAVSTEREKRVCVGRGKKKADRDEKGSCPMGHVSVSRNKKIKSTMSCRVGIFGGACLVRRSRLSFLYGPVNLSNLGCSLTVCKWLLDGYEILDWTDSV